MENEDIIQSPDDSLNQSIQEQVVDSNIPTNTLSTVENIDSVKFESPEEIKPYIPKKPILEFDDIKSFIGSYLNPKEKPDELSGFGTKPVKYGVFFDVATDFFNEAEKQRAEKQLAENPNILRVNSTTYVDTITGENIYKESSIPKLIEAPLYGLQYGLYQGISTIAAGIDYTLDTNTLTAVNETYEKYKLEKPDTLVGEILSTLAEYYVPIKYLNKFKAPLEVLIKSKLKENLEPFGKDLSSVRLAEKGIDYIGTGVAFGVADFINAGAGRNTAYETITGEKRLESEEGLSGRELAATRFRNKIRFGQEGVILGAVGHAVGSALPTALKYGLVKPSVGLYNIGSKAANAVVYNPIASVLSKSDTVVPAIASAIRNGSQYTKEAFLEPIIRGVKIEYKNGIPVAVPKYTGEIPPYKEWKLFDVTDASPFKVRLKKLDNYVRYFTESFDKPSAAYVVSEKAYANLKGQSKAISKYLDDLEQRSYDLAKSFGEQYKNGPSSEGSREYYLNMVEEFLKNQRKLNSLPKELQETSAALKEHFNNAKKAFINLLPEGEVKNQFSRIIKNYIKKSFAVFTNPEYQPPKDIMNYAIKEGIEIIKKNKDMIIAAKEQFPNLPITRAIINYSEALMKDILRTAKADTADPLIALKNIGKEKLKLNKSILSGDELPITIKKLLGEEKNLRSSVLQTTSSFLTQTINKRLYDDIAKIGLKEGWLKLSKGMNQNMQQIGKISNLGLMESNLNKLYANSDIALALQGNGILDSWIKADWYRGLMQLKAGIQFGKTVLSPESQIKNVVTNVGFPIAYGWVGGKTSLTDAVRIITGDIFGAGKEFNTPAFIKNIEKLTQLKVLDDNIVASELALIIKQLQNGTIKYSNELFKKLADKKIIQTSSKLYQGGDNIWRLLGYEWNNAYLTKAFKGDLTKLIKQQELIIGEKYNPISIITGKTKTFAEAVDEFSAWYVRKLMPTYSELPEAVKLLRKLPPGNFISWASAMLKVGGEGIRVALRETSSDMPEMRQLGLRKLIGLFTTYGGAGYAIDGLAENLTGVTSEQIKAYKRSFAADYNKNASISPYSPIKDNILKITNFSFGDVFDTIKKPARAALTELGKIKKIEDVDDFVFKAVLNATSELIKPYISEPLGTQTILEVLPKGFPFGKGGVKKDGTRIYSETDNFDDKLEKSLIHMLIAPAPGFVNTTIKYGESVYDLFTGRSRPDDLRNKFIGTLSGTKVENVDLQKSFDSKVLEMYPRIKTEIFATEGFYSSKDWQKRKPSVMAKEFENIQKESFEQQKQLYQIIQDARILKISEDVIEDALRKKFDKTFVRNILDGEMTPSKYSKKILESRYDKIERDEKLAGRGVPNENFVIPTDRLDNVLDKHDGISLKIDYENAISKKRKSSEESPGINQVFPKIPLRKESDEQSNIQTPALPNTPQPVATSNIMPQVNPTTKLTSVESALLSPTEQAIRQTQRS